MRTVSKEGVITEYERAVCYYTLPKVISPVTIGLIFAYALCVVESLAALAYGIHIDNRTWTLAGFYTFIGILIFGMIAFTMRALLNDWRIRVALAIARNVPEPERDHDIPDPFEHHILLSRPAQPGKEGFECMDEAGDISHCVEIKQYNVHWHVRSARSNAVFDVRAVHGAQQLRVYTGKEQVASIQRRATLRDAKVEIFPADPAQRPYSITNGCIYDGGRLAGRIYRLHRRIFLDIERVRLSDGLLAHFISMR